MCRVIGFVNQKGGVSKTTSSNNMAYILANDYGKKVLLMDFDGQGNTTDCMGVLQAYNEQNKEGKTALYLDDIPYTITDIIEKLIKEEELPKEEEYIYHTKGVDVIPADIDLNNFEDYLTKVDFKRENIIKPFIDGFRDKYDYIIIDSLPKLGIQMINVLFASDEIIIPTNTSKKALKGFNDLLKTIDKVKKNGNEKLKVAGILFTMVPEGTSVAAYYENEIPKVYSKDIPFFNTIIPYVKIFEESDLYGKVWVEYKPKHKCSIRYKEWVEEYLQKNGGI